MTLLFNKPLLLFVRVWSAFAALYTFSLSDIIIQSYILVDYNR